MNMRRRHKAAAFLAAIAAGAAVVTSTVGRQLGGPDDAPRKEPTALAWMDDPYVVIIPAGSYQSIVVSPQVGGGTAAGSIVPFVIRGRGAGGVVSDYPFFVPAGDIRTIEFPQGLRLTTSTALLSPSNVSFAAWGVGTAARTSEGAVGAGTLVRFDPFGRDPGRESRDRQRNREFDEFLREVERQR